MESIGDFILVILHCLAHIKVDDLKDDANPLFLRNFYKVSGDFNTLNPVLKTS